MWEWMTDAASNIWDWGAEALSGNNLGTTLEGAGAIAGALAAYDANEYKKDLLEYEKAQAAEEKARRDKAQAQLDNAVSSIWG